VVLEINPRTFGHAWSTALVQPENGCIPHLLIVSFGVERLQSPPTRRASLVARMGPLHEFPRLATERAGGARPHAREDSHLGALQDSHERLARQILHRVSRKAIRPPY